MKQLGRVINKYIPGRPTPGSVAYTQHEVRPYLGSANGTGQ